MAIEFGCGECGKLLRVPDDAAGKQARCPSCGGIQRVLERDVQTQPASTAPSSPQSQPHLDGLPKVRGESQPSDHDLTDSASPFNPSPSDNPFGEQATEVAGNPFAASEENPYKSPATSTGPVQSMFAGGNRDWARVSVEGPANSLAAVAGVVIFFSLIRLAFNLVQLLDGGDIEVFGMALIGKIVILIPYIVVMFGSMRMKQLKNYNLSIATSILAMIPCSGCCIVGLPVGIWALVVLLKPEIRAAFR